MNNDNLIAQYLNTGQQRNVHLFIATPCYGGVVQEQYMRSVCDLQRLLDKLNISFDFHTISNESLVTRARNSLIAKFIGDKKASHLIFIDADIGFNPKSVLRLLALNEDVVGGCYPKKNVNWEKVKTVLKDRPETNIDDLHPQGLDYVVNIVAEENRGQKEVPIRDGFVKVMNIGTGFLMIKKKAIRKMIEKYPNDTYMNDISGYDSDQTKGNFYLFFDTMVHPETRRYLSEDYAFCHKWMNCGGSIWMDLFSPLTHSGNFNYQGNVISALKDHISEKKISNKEDTKNTDSNRNEINKNNIF